MRRELEQRTQHPDESLWEFVRAMQELFVLAESSAPNAEQVERVIRQSLQTFAAYRRGSRFRDLNKLASEARQIQGGILAARAYRPPPPASAALEPRCAWNGDTASRYRRHEAAHYADERSRNTYDISWRIPLVVLERAGIDVSGASLFHLAIGIETDVFHWSFWISSRSRSRSGSEKSRSDDFGGFNRKPAGPALGAHA
ncbi:hypothetical protein HPB47_007888 [Ixodes persulcatus]|uniref:Uncharacterized protein n=1 Tax=Ixodes persulcatus TaxID=34615 RepID=A0AC60P698_IXOPE|nr:hypothetical protein HPB47_007888 [Ixodes persulcatus]